MARSMSKRNSANASTAKPSGKIPPGDKSFGLEQYIRFYLVEDGDNTEEGEESEILIIHDKILTETNQRSI